MTRVAIAGAGIGGLTAAIILARAGVQVDVIERAAILSEAGAGVQLSPNATRILDRLGLIERIGAAAVRLETVRIRRGRDGADLATMQLGPAATARYGAPFLVVHRADLQAALVEAVRGEPAIALTTGERLDGFVIEGNRVILNLSAGMRSRHHVVDGLIGADGLRSTVRAALQPATVDRPAFAGRTAWRSLVPAADAPAQARRRSSNLLLGPKAHLVHYPVRGGTLINVVAIIQDDDWTAAGADTWSQPGDPDRLIRRFAGWAGEARALLDAAPDWRIWPLFERPPLARWSQGPVTLLGDAAHPMLPFLAQGAAQAIEDGWALGQALGAGRPFAEAASAYERFRRPTAARVQRDSRRQGRIYHLSGPAAVMRDVAIGMLGSSRMLARYDWLYGEPTPS